MNYTNNSVQRYSDVDILSTQGRIGGKRYFVYSIVLPVLIFWAIATIAAIASNIPIAGTILFNIVMGIAVLGAMMISVLLTIQRCHDFNKRGSFAVLAIIPFVNIVFAMIPGTNGLNSYGEAPMPPNTGLLTSFYGLIVLLIALALYAAFNFIGSDLIAQLLA